jgi:L-aspartate oxidase
MRDMEFVQFHPTALAVEGAPRFLLSEALRGEGGVLLDLSGHRFMPDVDPRRAELAPRDVVARAIAGRMERTGDSHVLLDMTGSDAGFLKSRFPRIHATCLRFGIDIARDPIPVSPCAHYMMGGVATDLSGRTSIAGLYAAGETACTGVHGANRLASNSLLEGLVYGARAGAAVVGDTGQGAFPEWMPGGRPLRPSATTGERSPGGLVPATAGAAERVAREVRSITWLGAGLSRDGRGLTRALGELEALGWRAAESGGEPPTRAGAEACNLLDVAWLVARAALVREESRGAHSRSDHLRPVTCVVARVWTRRSRPARPDPRGKPMLPPPRGSRRARSLRR